LASPLLQLLHNVRMARKALLGRIADLGDVERIGWDAFFLDEFLDL